MGQAKIGDSRVRCLGGFQRHSAHRQLRSPFPALLAVRLKLKVGRSTAESTPTKGPSTAFVSNPAAFEFSRQGKEGEKPNRRSAPDRFYRTVVGPWRVPKTEPRTNGGIHGNWARLAIATRAVRFVPATPLSSPGLCNFARSGWRSSLIVLVFFLVFVLFSVFSHFRVRRALADSFGSHNCAVVSRGGVSGPPSDSAFIRRSSTPRHARPTSLNSFDHVRIQKCAIIVCKNSVSRRGRLEFVGARGIVRPGIERNSSMIGLRSHKTAGSGLARRNVSSAAPAVSIIRGARRRGEKEKGSLEGGKESFQAPRWPTRLTRATEK